MRSLCRVITIVFVLALINAPTARANLGSQGPTPPAEWTSLYQGKEKVFQEALRQEIKNICDSYGIPYQVTADNKILVPTKSRSSILSLISNHYKK
jgi:hypothetical protein